MDEESNELIQIMKKQEASLKISEAICSFSGKTGVHIKMN